MIWSRSGHQYFYDFDLPQLNGQEMKKRPLVRIYKGRQ
jgi:hypothetical protein